MLRPQKYIPLHRTEKVLREKTTWRSYGPATFHIPISYWLFTNMQSKLMQKIGIAQETSPLPEEVSSVDAYLSSFIYYYWNGCRKSWNSVPRAHQVLDEIVLLLFKNSRQKSKLKVPSMLSCCTAALCISQSILKIYWKGTEMPVQKKFTDKYHFVWIC